MQNLALQNKKKLVRGDFAMRLRGQELKGGGYTPRSYHLAKSQRGGGMSMGADVPCCRQLLRIEHPYPLLYRAPAL